MWNKGVVIQRIEWHKGLISLIIEANLDDFIAGQFIKLSIEQEDKRISRAYSLVNSPDEKYLEVLITLVPNGDLSSYLFSLKEGDIIDVSCQAEGYLTLKDLPVLPEQNLWMLATGTGVGPFISILKTDNVWQRYKTVFLVYSVRYISDLAYLSFLLELERYHNFKLILCVTRENMENTFRHRIPYIIENGDLELFTNEELKPKKSQLMLCGNPQMIAETKFVLADRGFQKHLNRAAGQYITENYWIRS